MDDYKDITGQRFGKLTAVQFSQRKSNRTYWLFRCDCGNLIERSVDHLSEKSSCGCDRHKDLTGQRFGRLVVDHFIGHKDGSKDIYWSCKCDCGNIVNVKAPQLYTGKTKSCGCLKKETAKYNNYKYANLIGERFGMLTVTEQLPSDKNGVVWKCKCDCGNTINTHANELHSGKKRSCGCGDNKMYCVYKHVSPDNKVYIGITSRMPQSIWFNGHIYNNQYAFAKAINAIGGYEQFKIKFKHYYLDIDEKWVEIKEKLPFSITNLFSPEKAAEYQKHYIAEYNATNPTYGFNARSGGMKDFLYTDQVKRRQSKTHSGDDGRTDWKVYLHKNTINGKIYIGITCREVNRRWQAGEGYKRPREQTIGLGHFYNAINKYGWDAFTHEIIADGLTLEQASEWEQKLIEQYDSTNPDKGYNIAKGGKGTTGAKHRDSTKKLLSEKAKKRLADTGIVNFKGEHHSEETKKILSEKAIKRIAETGIVNFKGQHHSEETKEHLSELQKRPVTQYDKNGMKIKTFASVTEAANAVNVSIQSISSCIHKQSKVSAGYIWRHLDVAQLPETEMPIFTHASSRAVDQYSKFGELINTFPSLKAAAEAVNVKITSIHGAIKRGGCSAGFLWRYTDQRENDQDNIFRQLSFWEE